MINPDLLKTFMALAETGHFTRTAERLNMTQPGVSQHIKKLEAHFDTDLLLWEGKKFTLTEAGRRLHEYSKRMFADHEQFRSLIGKDDPFAGICRYSSPGSFGLRVFDALLEAVRVHPDLAVEMTVAPNSSIPALLLNRKIDVGFMTEHPSEPSLEVHVFAEEELLLLVPTSVGPVRSLARLREIGFVNHPDGPYLVNRLLAENFPDDFEGARGFQSRVFINQINRILDPVAQGLGFTVLPETAYRMYAQKEKVRAQRLKKQVKETVLKVTRRNENLPARYQTVEALLK